MSENLTPFEHRLLRSLEQISLRLGEIGEAIDILNDHVLEGVFGDPKQSTMDAFP